jgi:hypothetical protein
VKTGITKIGSILFFGNHIGNRKRLKHYLRTLKTGFAYLNLQKITGGHKLINVHMKKLLLNSFYQIFRALHAKIWGNIAKFGGKIAKF